ncbi:signal transduction histidine kinase [Knoellia remsis]|uniref:histidine kinase n=1 Tax=Knoellia remsis TaxID=407159 RepID=A0A2T0UCV8_9MICO|nr:histidine kinase [Knoellia remsis]PRY55647.1 signal transduction histidine kinase [Knoellia remsis]
MPSARPSLPARLGGRLRAFFALDDEWVRPSPGIGQSDLTFGLVMLGLGLRALELSRSAGGLTGVTEPRWVQMLTVAAGALPLVARRRYPVAVGVFLALHMFVVGVTMGPVMGQLAMQISYFIALFSLVAWSRSRRTAVVVGGGIIAFMLLWVVWQFALGSGASEYLDARPEDASTGIFAPLPAAIILSFAVNILYFLGALVGGQVAWRGARQRAALEAQAATIHEQADSLRRRAVVDERLRIARELHDVVGHHVAVIGIQAGAARRVLDRRPAEAAAALGRIESSSRDAVTQMRGLLGTLRDIEDTADGTNPDVSQGSRDGDSRTPEPTLADLATLVGDHDSGSLRTAYRLVESRDGAHRDVPAPVGLTLYRIAQEALANVSRHSTATRVDVVARVECEGRAYAEVEVVDNGRPRAGTSGSGLGQLGMRERAASHKGMVDIGPRPVGGYRVRVRIPLGEKDV